MLPLDVAIPCQSIPLAEADKLFFSENAKKQAKAKALCSECSVIDKCLQFALDQKIEFGIFGGKTAQERKAL